MNFSKTKKISRFFTEHEAYFSIRAEMSGISNEPVNELHERNVRLTASKLDLIREFIKEPIFVTSWYRSPLLNSSINNASATSQHMKGEAVDMYTKGINNRQLFDVIRGKFTFDQLILEFPDKNGIPRWVHVSFKHDAPQRNQILVAIKNKDGSVNYVPFVESSFPYVKKKVKNY